MRYIPAIYLVLSVLALGVFIAGLPVVAGDDADPIAAVYALLLALPLILVLEILGEVPTAAMVALILLAMGANYMALRLLGRRWRPASSDAATPRATPEARSRPASS